MSKLNKRMVAFHLLKTILEFDDGDDK